MGPPVLQSPAWFLPWAAEIQKHIVMYKKISESPLPPAEHKALFFLI